MAYYRVSIMDCLRFLDSENKKIKWMKNTDFLLKRKMEQITDNEKYKLFRIDK